MLLVLPENRSFQSHKFLKTINEIDGERVEWRIELTFRKCVNFIELLCLRNDKCAIPRVGVVFFDIL